MTTQWPDWHLADPNDLPAVRRSMQTLARYTNPDMTRRYGLGQGHTRLLDGQRDKREQATTLADAFVRQRIRYTREIFNPRATGGQIIRTTQELFDGSGTCLDFAVTLAALLTQQDIPAVLAVAIDTDHNGRHDGDGHAFILTYDDESAETSSGNPPLRWSYQELHAELSRSPGTFRLLDTTPFYDDDGTTLTDRNNDTLGRLEADSGWVYTVDVRRALNELDVDYYTPPASARSLGITAYLPDPASATLPFPSQDHLRERLSTMTGRIVLVGASGTGKSTAALDRATEVNSHRGWFLDSSDPATFTRSLAAAEAQSRGEPLGPEEKDNLVTRTYHAYRRLQRSERPWVVIVDNANALEKILPLLPVPRPPVHSADDPNRLQRPGDVLVVTTTDTARVAQLDETMWQIERVGGLDEDEVAEVAQEVWKHLDAAERLPGLVRIAQQCGPQRLDDQQREPPGAARIVRAALARPTGAEADTLESRQPMLDAVFAASFMPAEQISVGWVADAVFDGDMPRAVEALARAERAGLVERSRADDTGHPGHHPLLWMHRLVRAAVHELAPRAVGMSTLAKFQPQRYSREEITELVAFVRRRADETWTSMDEVFALVTVLDLLEPRGGDALPPAAELARSYLDDRDAPRDLDTLRGVTAYAQGQMAVARLVSHGQEKGVVAIEDGLARCGAVVEACDRLLADLPAGRQRDDAILLRGRANAMRGNLVRKQASQIPNKIDDERKDRLHRECISILTGSYTERRAVFDDGRGGLRPDPDRHLDRGLYNLGGANISLANFRRAVDPDESGRRRVADAVTAAMAGYAGSLALRRDDSTSYTAASLWGVALAAYTAALYCPGLLRLADVEPTEELQGIATVQTRTTLLQAAEHCAMRALMIWAELDGAQGNARQLLRKISLVWGLTESDPDQWPDELAAAIRPVLKDLGVEDLHVQK